MARWADLRKVLPGSVCSSGAKALYVRPNRVRLIGGRCVILSLSRRIAMLEAFSAEIKLLDTKLTELRGYL
jgi:hypothetical protein